ncbi:MAG: hypothetical protein LBI17_00455 [Rickettsiales bacterium]|jgi:hypothetical protein|nr:hypothetical protein [Rickettsiales bacterium]
MLYSEEYWRDTIGRLGLPEMPISKAAYKTKDRNVVGPFMDAFPKIAKKAVQFAYYNNMKELVDAGFEHDAIMEMGRGAIPENVDVYPKRPAEYGGELDFSNVFLVRRHPFKQMLDTFIGRQVLAFAKEHPLYDKENGFALPTELFVPDPKGIIFLPALKGFLGPGGNSSTDRMTEAGGTVSSAGKVTTFSLADIMNAKEGGKGGGA